MKLQNLLRSIVLAGAAVAGTANAVVVFSENFDQFGAFVPAVGFQPAFGILPLPNFGAWGLAGGVDLIRGNYGAIDNVSVDMLGSPGPGTLSRTFEAIAGLTYTLSWDWYRNGDGSPLEVTLGSNVVQAGAPNVLTPSHMNWLATSNGTQTVAFRGIVTTQIFQGSTIDNIVLTAVPEPGPATLILSGLCVVGFLARRRMQSA